LPLPEENLFVTILTAFKQMFLLYGQKLHPQKIWLQKTPLIIAQAQACNDPSGE
jgi:ATP/ADP translocase